MRQHVLACALALAPVFAGAECRQALVLGLDVSGSVDAREYRLQLDGLASALETPALRDALLSLPEVPVRLAVFEWSGPSDQRIVVPPTDLKDATTLRAVTARLRATRRQISDPTTALGTALRTGAALADQGCWRQTLDISGDGPSNAGPRPQDLSALPPTLTINGLVIGTQDGSSPGQVTRSLDALEGYYEAWVLRGPDAFVERARSYNDYAEAMTRKLLREVLSLAIGGLESPADQG